VSCFAPRNSLFLLQETTGKKKKEKREKRRSQLRSQRANKKKTGWDSENDQQPGLPIILIPNGRGERKPCKRHRLFLIVVVETKGFFLGNRLQDLAAGGRGDRKKTTLLGRWAHTESWDLVGLSFAGGEKNLPRTDLPKNQFPTLLEILLASRFDRQLHL